MKTSGNTVLITGGASGIGFALAEAFVKSGNKVLICGRRRGRLVEAQEKLPGIEVRQCDVSKQADRESLFDWMKVEHQGVNILVNNAGIQRAIDLKRGAADLLGGEDEVQVNFVAPMHLSSLFAPLLMTGAEAAIINVSSGLAFVPIATIPVYCATKAGIHMFTVCLRHQLRGTSVKVFEIVPPSVDTELGIGSTRRAGQTHGGIPATEVAVETLRALENDQCEIVVGRARGLVEGSRQDFEGKFQELNRW
jgi:uncharacterized oxidoreductase